MEEICCNLGSAWEVCREGINLYRVSAMVRKMVKMVGLDWKEVCSKAAKNVLYLSFSLLPLWALRNGGKSLKPLDTLSIWHLPHFCRDPPTPCIIQVPATWWGVNLLGRALLIYTWWSVWCVTAVLYLDDWVCAWYLGLRLSTGKGTTVLQSH